MIALRFIVFLILLSGYNAVAEIISIPENCISEEVSPCLLKSTENKTLQGKSKLFSLSVEEEAIVKIIQFSSPFKFELLQGKIFIQSASKKKIQFSLNEINFDSKAIFAKLNSEHRLQVYDTKNFILAEYEPGIEKNKETVIRKSEFLSKIDMVRYLAEFFQNKRSFVSYLKSIESRWKDELKSQTNDQTIALQRSIASIEKAEADAKELSKKEAEELKKVRRQFFYRTFYR